MSCTLTFYGAAGTVTGSCFLLEVSGFKLLVDCGLFQGSKTVTELNYDPFPFQADSIDAVLLTHAHIDHSGLVPKLAAQGYTGPFHATAGTRDLLSYMLPDSGYIQEQEVERRNVRRMRQGKAPFEPIYTRKDAERVIDQFTTHDYEIWVDIATGVRARFWNAGHILGSASIELEVAHGPSGDEPLRLLFSGDLGPEHKSFHPDPDAPSGFDYVICESTYGDRQRHELPAEDRRRCLGELATQTFARDGALLIPAFAVERTQELLSDLVTMMLDGDLQSVPVFLDSPLARNATRVFMRHAGKLEDLEAIEKPFQLPNFHFTESVEQSKSLDRLSGPMIIISASGMCDAGRIRHHLKSFLWRPSTTVLLAGYQVPGTLGHILASGRRTVRIHREDIDVKAKIEYVDWYSGHADKDSLVDWITERQPVRRGLFLVHGEAPAAGSLEAAVKAAVPEQTIVIPGLDESFELQSATPKPIHRKSRRRLEPEQLDKEEDWRGLLAEFSIDLRKKLEQQNKDRAREKMLADLKTVLDRYDRHRTETKKSSKPKP